MSVFQDGNNDDAGIRRVRGFAACIFDDTFLK
jgi:hypothetical protein